MILGWTAAAEVAVHIGENSHAAWRDRLVFRRQGGMDRGIMISIEGRLTQRGTPRFCPSQLAGAFQGRLPSWSPEVTQEVKTVAIIANRMARPQIFQADGAAGVGIAYLKE